MTKRNRYRPPVQKSARDVVIERGMGMTSEAILLGRSLDRPIILPGDPIDELIVAGKIRRTPLSRQ